MMSSEQTTTAVLVANMQQAVTDICQVDASYLIAVSGGCDSTALLHACYQQNIKNIIVAHVNYQLRGEASTADAQFCRLLAKQYNYPYQEKVVTIPKKVKGIEDFARQARQQFFAELAQQFTVQTVLLAHHQNDQVETILQQLLRGSYYYRGMLGKQAMRHEHIQWQIVRPWLNFSRKQIKQYHDYYHLSYREDESNKQLFCNRNRIRWQLLPLMHDIFPRDINQQLLASAVKNQQQFAYFNDQYPLAKFLDKTGQKLVVSALLDIHIVAQKHVLQQYLTMQNVANISQSLIEQCGQLLQDHSCAKVNLPKGIWLRRKQKRIFICRGE